MAAIKIIKLSTLIKLSMCVYKVCVVSSVRAGAGTPPLNCNYKSSVGLL